MARKPTRVLYLTPSLEERDEGGNALRWFSGIDHDRWSASIVTTQPADNTGLRELEPFAAEIWDLPDLMPGGAFPGFILGLIESREIQVLHILESRLGFDLLPDIACLPQPPVVVVQLDNGAPHTDYVRYVTRRYGNLVDAFSVPGDRVKDAVVAHEIPPSRVEVIPDTSNSDGFSRRHEELYRRLLNSRPVSSRWRNASLLGGEDRTGGGVDAGKPLQILLPRDPCPERSIGVVVPCFRHGIFLGECIESIRMQTLQPTRIIVVDDGSDDPETIAAIGELETEPGIEVIRQHSNMGPSAARNRALDILDTNYMLPIDADDKLFPDALERMVQRLEVASPEVGFVYPHAQHFGNRTDFVRLPAYNLWLLMQENYCPAPALFDRRVFGEGGVRYPEDIVVGHEDWDLVLQLGERGIVGLHADGPTFMYRRQGFSRVNAVDYGPEEFHNAIERRHPVLYDNADEIKAAWAPAVSVILLDDGRGWQSTDLSECPFQTCGDFELLGRSELGDGVRPVESEQSDLLAWLQHALDAARGRWICILAPAATSALGNPTFVELLIYALTEHQNRLVLALGSANDVRRHFLAQLDEHEYQSADPIGIAFERRAVIALPDISVSGRARLLEEVLLGLQGTELIQWRLLPSAAAAEPHKPDRETRPDLLRFDFDRSVDQSIFATSDLIAHQSPRLPELAAGTARRWKESAGWTPPETVQLCRHVSFDGKHRIIANHRYSPPGYTIEFDLGAIHMNAAPGMKRLVHSDNSFELIDDQNRLGEERHGLGYVDEENLPQLERLELRRMPDGKQDILVAGSRDPLAGTGELLAEFGWIEAFPLNPQEIPLHTGPWRAISLWRSADSSGYRHRYSVGAQPSPDAIKLGALYPIAEGLVALEQRPDGRLATSLAQPGRASRDPRRFVRWLAARDAGTPSAGARESGARLAHLVRHPGSRRRDGGAGEVMGALRGNGARGFFPLFSTTHPVTGDQLVTCAPAAALARGYLQDGVLGYVHLSSGNPNDLR